VVYDVALALGKWPGDVMDRPLEELRGLLAFMAWRAAQKGQG